MSDPTLERTIALHLYNVDRDGDLELLTLEGRGAGFAAVLGLFFLPEHLTPFLEAMRATPLEAQIVIRARP